MMSMLNQAAVEALCSATYLENYLDCMENLPDDLQRVVSQLRELDAQTNDIMQEIAHNKEVYIREADGAKKQRSLIQIQRGLIRSQEIGDEKLQLVGVIVEFIENRTRQLEQDLENLDPGGAEAKEEKPEKPKVETTKSSKSLTTIPAVSPPTTPQSVSLSVSTTAASSQTTPKASSSTVDVKTETPIASKVKRQRRQRTHQEANKEEEKKEEEEKQQPKKKKKRKAKKTDKGFEKTLVGEPIDPDEPTYCLCEQVSYGDMIGCDNDNCAIEWFHFNCVGLCNKPKGKWYCPKCRGDKPNVKRSDLK